MKKEDLILQRIVEILEQDIPQEALAEGNLTPEQEAKSYIQQELDKAREEGRNEAGKLFVEIFTTEPVSIKEDIEKKGENRYQFNGYSMSVRDVEALGQKFLDKLLKQ